MIIKHEESIESDFEGTIIDIETIGEFNRKPEYTNDSREYKDMQQVILGFINRHILRIFCAKGRGAIRELNEETQKLINELEKPFYAFNCDFERGVLFYNLGMRIGFDWELNRERFERKAAAVSELGIPNYDDPFFDKGAECMGAWANGDFDKAIAHNRACLLKERDILLKRPPRKPDELIFTPV